MKLTIPNPLRLLCWLDLHPFRRRDPEAREYAKGVRKRCRVCGQFTRLMLIGTAIAMQCCAGGSTSEITPARSDAAEKSFRVTGESSRRNKTTITIQMPSAEVAADTSEDK